MLTTTNNVKVDPVPVDLKISVSYETIIAVLVVVLIYSIVKIKG